MKLQDQVCTLEQAKRLVVLGVYCPSAFVYFTTGVHSGIALGNMYMRHIWILTGNAYEEKEVNITPAYTVAELMVALCMDYAGNLMPSLTHYHDWMNEQHINHESSASLHAELLIQLIENKVFTIDQINKRITQ